MQLVWLDLLEEVSYCNVMKKAVTPKTELVNLKAYRKQIDTRLRDASVLNPSFIR